MSIKLSTISIEVSDLAHSKAFYTSMLEMTENEKRSHPPTFAYLESDACALTMTSPHEANKPETSNTIEFGFQADDLAVVKAKLEAGGTAVHENTMGWGSALELGDPDGYRIVIYKLAR